MKELEKKGDGNTTRPELIPQGDPFVKETLDLNETEDQRNPDSSQRTTTSLRKVLRSERDRPKQNPDLSQRVSTSLGKTRNPNESEASARNKTLSYRRRKTDHPPSKNHTQRRKTDGGKQTQMSASEGTHAKPQAGQYQKQNGSERNPQNKRRETNS